MLLACNAIWAYLVNSYSKGGAKAYKGIEAGEFRIHFSIRQLKKIDLPTWPKAIAGWNQKRIYKIKSSLIPIGSPCSRKTLMLFDFHENMHYRAEKMNKR